MLCCSGLVLRVLFQSQQLWLITAGEDGLVKLWDLVAKSCIATLKARPDTISCGFGHVWLCEGSWQSRKT